MIEYRTRDEDKARWGNGPWVDEPDKVQWVDEVTGLDCLIVRNRFGGLCGYVGVPPEHPWHGVDYSGCLEGGCGWDYCEHGPDGKVNVHGGLTYAASCQSGHESVAICHIPEDGRPDNVWWFGFDCVHAFDFAPGAHYPPMRDEVYRDIGYVQDQVRSLAAQLAEAKEPA